MPAINARTRPVVDYGVDERGWSWFRRLSRALHGGISGSSSRTVIDTQRVFHGTIAAQPQEFTGMAPLGAVRPVVKAGSTISDERAAGVLDNGSMRIFAERLRRGK